MKPMNTFLKAGFSCALAIALTAPSASAQRNLTDIPNPDPEVERASFQVADGFEVNLYAADPLLAKPIQMNFDPQGRLWVASSEVYPQIEPGQRANDKILILEDADHDGRAEKTTIFADGLLIPTGVEPGDGGAYVANSTELLHFSDTDGDGKADRRRVVLSGFGTEDTHHILHTLRWGYDGCLYMNQSIYIHSHVETPWGVKRLNAGGVWRFRPERMKLDVFDYGLVNSWGHHFDKFGQHFQTDGAGGEGINYAIPGAYYFTTAYPAKILRGLNPGSPKHCGLEVVDGRHLPESWQGSLITNDFRGNRVCRFVLSDSGSGYVSREQPEVIKTSHVAFRPIDIKMGPDGAIYIADWYNPIIQHGEVDFRDPRRDHTRGRIWRVTAKGRPLAPWPKLVGAPVQELLEQLKSPEGWTRQQARRVLKEMGPSQVLPALADWTKSITGEDAAADRQRLESLWMYVAFDEPELPLLDKVLKAKTPEVRAAGCRVVSHWQDRVPNALDLMKIAAGDAFPRVRLEAARTLGTIGTPAATVAALTTLKPGTDTFLDYGVYLTARETASKWVPAWAKGEFEFDSVDSTLFAASSAESGDVVPGIVARVKDGRIPSDKRDAAFSLVATLGRPDDLSLILDTAIADPKSATAGLNSLAGAVNSRQLKPTGDLNRLTPLVNSQDTTVARSAVNLAGLWKLDSLKPAILALASSGQTNPEFRAACVEALGRFGGADVIAALKSLVSNRDADVVREKALESLIQAAPGEAATIVADRLSTGFERESLTGIVERVVRSRPAAESLSKALTGRALDRESARLALRVARSGGRADLKPLADLLEKSAQGGPAIPLPTDDAAMATLIGEIRSQGDPARGETVFRRAELNCYKCHGIGTAGGLVGPNLQSLGASSQPDYIVRSILDPAAAVKEGYNAVVVAMNDGRILTGIPIGQSGTELILRDAEGQELKLPKDQIEDQKPTGSLMPAGLVDSLSRGELIDLMRFLTELGKLGPYAFPKERIARHYQVLEADNESRTALSRLSHGAIARGDAAEAKNLHWRPAYARVAGELPMSDVPIVAAQSRAPARFVRFSFEAKSAGDVILKLSGNEGVQVWLDGVAVNAAPETKLSVQPGRRTVVVATDPEKPSQNLKIEISDSSTAQVELPTGP
ncbi:c-type cytochrome [bacterium]|nr:c-type cytochrome [bacterium]